MFHFPFHSLIFPGNNENRSQLGKRLDSTEAKEQGTRRIFGRFAAASDGDASENSSESFPAEKSFETKVNFTLKSRKI